MSKVFYVAWQGAPISPPFAAWAEAWAWKAEVQDGDEVICLDDPTAPEDVRPSAPEPQEMTHAWVAAMKRVM